MKASKTIIILIFLFLTTALSSQAQSAPQKPIRLVVAGVSHGHISFILGRDNKGDFELAGVYDSNLKLAESLANKYGFSKNLISDNLIEMLDKVKPQAVVAFGSIYDHMAVVEACAPRGIHVMVEKPLATNVKHAKKMVALAKKYNIHLLTDYETSWYPTTLKSFELVNDSNYVGAIKKVVIHNGHMGPKEIGCDKYFLDWLTDPKLNGGGALIDFGCYGANLMTYLTKGEKPISVSAVTRQYKPDVYPNVDDDATIVVNFPNSQCIIQASWNWPFSRKDMEIYGTDGYIFADNNTDMRLRKNGMDSEKSIKVSANDCAVYTDPFIYFANVIFNKVTVPTYGVYSFENNLQVVKILEAARKSAKSGKTIRIK